MTTNPFNCDDKERLVAYLYDEISDVDRAAITAHLAACRACAGEVADFQSVRADLGSWQPPATDLGFRIVRAPVAAPRTWWRPPVWAPMALAAGLLLAVGAALANVEVQTGGGGVTIRAGWSHPPLAAATAPAATQPASPARSTAAVAPVRTGMSEADVRQAMADLESRLRAEFAASARSGAPVTASAATSSVDRGQLLQQVRSLVDESERRQQRELALRLAQVVQDFDNQRRTDLVRIEQGFGQIESLTGREAERQRQITNYLVRASQRQ